MKHSPIFKSLWTFREITEALGLPYNSAHYHLRYIPIPKRHKGGEKRNYTYSEVKVIANYFNAECPKPKV